MVRSYVLDGLIHDSDEHSREIATYIAGTYGEPRRRIANLAIAPRNTDHATVLFPAILALELTDEVAVLERPPGGITIDQDSVVEGISHNIGPLSWETSYDLSPAGTDTYWQIGVPGASEIGVTTRVGF